MPQGDDVTFEDPESAIEGTIEESDGVAFIEALKELRQRVAGLATRDLERQSARSESLHNECAPIMRLFNHELVWFMTLVTLIAVSNNGRLVDQLNPIETQHLIHVVSQFRLSSITEL